MKTNIRGVWSCAMLLFFSFSAVSSLAMAQMDDDPVLMCVNGRKVLRSEYEYACRTIALPAGVRASGEEERAQAYAGFLLRVSAAEAAGLDTLLTLCHEIESYRNQLLHHCLTDETATDGKWCVQHEPTKTRYGTERLFVSHIFRALPQQVMPSVLHEVEEQMDSVYQALCTGTSFEEMVRRYSDEKEPFWLHRLQVSAELENVAFGLEPGQFSHPFFTPEGLHIVKLLERREFSSFEQWPASRKPISVAPVASRKEAAKVAERLKQIFHCQIDKSGVEELLSKGETGRVLFRLDDREYTGREFSFFLSALPGSIHQRLDDFIHKSVLDYAAMHTESLCPDFSLQIGGRRDTLLAEAALRHYALPDSVALMEYFNQHKTDYHWPVSRYRGIVLHCTTKRMARQVRKFLKELPEEEWMQAIRLTFNANPQPLVQAEQGIFAPGDNPYVDEKVYGCGRAEPVAAYPFTVLLGRKQKGPEDWREVRSQLEMDCKAWKIASWDATLRASGMVEINQEVLKTVNNH